MRSSRKMQIGGAGASEVTAAFELLGWGTVENTRHDLGTDLYVCARDERLFDLGLLVGVQVKTGEITGARRSRYFREEVRDPDGAVSGWWFRDDDRSHIDAWLSHGLPHLIVLHDLTSRTSYWEHVTSETVVPTGKGAKVLVQKANTIDDAHQDALLKVAATVRAGVAWEGSAWIGAAAMDILHGHRDASGSARRRRMARCLALRPTTFVRRRRTGHPACGEAALRCTSM
jgi:hypothetical protein